VRFFEPPPTPPDQPEPPPQPPWAGPAEVELGAPVPVRLVLARTEEAAVAITEVVAFSNGFEVLVSARRRNVGGGTRRTFYGGMPMGPDDPNTLRFGIQFADGRKGSNIAFGGGGAIRLYYQAKQQGKEPELPEGPVIHPRGGGGGGTRFDYRFWVWPLPPAGKLVFACEWPALKVPESLQEIDAALILERAGDSMRLWD
jgi:hypothetical protein